MAIESMLNTVTNAVFGSTLAKTEALASAIEAPVASSTPPEAEPPPPVAKEETTQVAVPNESIVANNNITITQPAPILEKILAIGTGITTPNTGETTSNKAVVSEKEPSVAQSSIPATEKNLQETKTESNWFKKTGSVVGGMAKKTVAKVIDKAKNNELTAFTPLATDHPDFITKTGEFSEEARNNYKKELPTSSTDFLYNSWDARVEGKNIIIKQANGKEITIEKKSEAEAAFVKEAIRPTGVTSYKATQAENGNCLPLSQFQHMALTGERMDEFARAMQYDVTTGNVAMRFYDNNQEEKDYILTPSQITRGMTEGYNKTIARSTTHQKINVIQDLTLRHWARDNWGGLKDKDAQAPENIINNKRGITQIALAGNDGKYTKTKYISTPEGGIANHEWGYSPSRRLSVEQLSYMKEKSPHAAITLATNYGDYTKSDDVTTNSGIVPDHAYTLVKVDVATRTVFVVNPWDSSKLIALKDKDLFFDNAFIENS